MSHHIPDLYLYQGIAIATLTITVSFHQALCSDSFFSYPEAARFQHSIFFFVWLANTIHSVSQYVPRCCENRIRQIYLAMVIEELPLKLLPYHWHKNSILIKRETNALLTPIIALNICKTVSCSRSEIVWAAMGCLHKTLNQWIKNKIHSCSCTCSSSSLPAGLMFLHMQEHNDMKNQFYIWDMHQAKEENLMKGIVSVLLCFFHLLFWGQTWTSHVAEPMMYVRTGDPCSLSLYATFRSVLSCFSWVWLSYFTPYSIPKFIKKTGGLSIITVIVKAEILVPWRLLLEVVKFKGLLSKAFES